MADYPGFDKLTRIILKDIEAGIERYFAFLYLVLNIYT